MGSKSLKRKGWGFVGKPNPRVKAHSYKNTSVCCALGPVGVVAIRFQEDGFKAVTYLEFLKFVVDTIE